MISKRMIMKKLIFSISFFAVILATPSCKKVIDQVPSNTIYREGFWKTEQDANTAIAGTYARLRDVLNQSNRHYYYGEIPADVFASFAGDTFLPEVAKGKYTESYQDELRDWRPFYKISALANLVIEKVPEIPESAFKSGGATARDQIVGEALFIRALTYFYLTRIWGDCVYVTTVENDTQTEPDQPKTKKEIVLAGCIKDLVEAAAKMKFGYASANERAVRANKGSALALLAHIYAWTGDYDNAQKVADDVINNGGYSLLPINQMPALFQGKSVESIFEIEFESSNSEGNANGIARQLLVDPYIRNKNNAWFIDQTEMQKIYGDTTSTTKDKRVAAFFERSGNNVFCKKYSSVDYKDLANFADVRFDDNIVIFRLSDIMLLRAEALAKLNRFGDARLLLDAVRFRAGLDASTATEAELYDEVFNERCRELFLEGHKYWDMLRTQHFPSHLTQDKYNQGAYLWPIQKDVFLDNNVLTQNEYWISRY
jgi:starch-binding outer membrane protein, SusD/RagB family